ncbi:T9SS outer membrane translocon Sov/SprA [Cesiribacter andamanensis]|uniref:Cell surface protein SprA n=1 Tax=Cesiribacter andamanensis AMV16 TaxID=1279009 RepID=M7NBH6_9BACT|nr:cell surface protein SprA [Cesiribacter andamanensis]EMR04546.1 cell surface protein SprA [Cesiribacter andamanensis AMV16]
MLVAGLILQLALPLSVQAGALFLLQQQPTQARDTVGRDTTRTGSYQPSKFPTGAPRDRFGDPFSTRRYYSPLFPPPPTQLQLEIDTAFNYTVYENLGDFLYRPPSSLSFEQYQQLRRQQLIREYWQTQSQGLDGESAVSSRSLIPPIYTSPIIDRIFGGSFVNIRPNGFVNLDFGGDFQRVQNPAIPIRAQRQSQFNFDQQINMNVIGQVGEKLEIAANFDSNNSFDFENNFRVEYTGFPEEIIKKVEIGNVNLPVRNSLMSGAQSLFGVKTQLQFGKLFVTGVATTQRGESDVIEIEGGSRSNTLSIRASEYDANRHFFLSHFFRNRYGIEQGQWLNSLPQVTSGVNITRMEVYIINRNQQTEGLRNVAAFADLAETSLANPAGSTTPATNDANDLFARIRANTDLRSVDEVDRVLQGQFGMQNSRDYVLIKSARKLNATEFSYHTELGYISLNRQLQNDEALAVAFEYTYNGRRYQVGELTENYQNRPSNDVIFLKMLRSNNVDTRAHVWELMMKNIYSLNANQVAREGFQLRVVYRDDRSGLDQPNLQEGVDRRGEPLRNIPIIRLLGLDLLNPNNDRQPDGNFDFIEGVTINLDRGLIIFPVKEPFGDHLREQIGSGQPSITSKYVYDTLYRTTRYNAELVAEQNKYFLEVKYAASSSTEIPLDGINIAPGSVRVFAGNTPLTEGVDYQVDYDFGRVRILNEGIVNSGRKIRISYERASLLNFQTRRFLGTHFDYRFSDDISLGATLLYLNELPLISRVGIGQEPTKNTKWGLDANIQKDSYFLTRMLDALPLLQTKEMSTITFNAEFAQMLPGTSNVVNGEGTSYIDDFETAITPFRLDGNVYDWKHAATPLTNDNRFTSPNSELDFAYKRARLAWYTIDNIFYREVDRNRYAQGLSKSDMENNYVRQVIPQELFNRDIRNLQLNEPIFDLVYYPAERGPYNYNPAIGPGGSLPNPSQNWAGITRALPGDVDFNRTNIEYIEFWMMDPFITGPNGRNEAFRNHTIANEGSGGRLVFNLGSVSEDYIKDNQHGFENGLPPDGNLEGNANVTRTDWGYVTNRQYLNNAFDLNESSRRFQDVGMDGLPNEQEANFFRDVLGPAFQNVQDDPSGDNFRNYVSDVYNGTNANVLERYKYFNNEEGNTPLLNTSQGVVAQGNPRPDNEDLNRDNTINDLEQYYEYSIDLRPSRMQVGQNYIVDKKVTPPSQVNGEQVSWYLFRVPIREFTGTYGDPQGFETVRFLRTYLTGFTDPIALRFAKMQLVGSQWRRYTQDLRNEGLNVVGEEDFSNFTISAIGFEDNGQKEDIVSDPTTVPYVLPPNFVRDRDITAYNQDVRLNEQSIQMCIDELQDRDSRAIFKNVALDLINYGSIKMLLHAHAQQGSFVQDGEVTGFLRIGPDFTQNYYEIEIPLTITPPGSTLDTDIWPAENEIDISMDELYKLKSLRNRQNVSQDRRFAGVSGKHNIYVKGNPQLNDVRVLMIGVRNPEGGTDMSPKSVCVWANELRVANFDRTAGWATNARLNTKLADVANVTASTRYSSVGYGDISQRVNQRSRDENLSYDIAANVALEKFLPERSRLVVPMFVSYERNISTPYFDPASEDVPLDAALLAFESPRERAYYRMIAQQRATRRSLNFTNVRLTRREGDDTPTPFDLSNFSLTYAFSEVLSSSWEIASFVQRNYKGAVGYNYQPKVTPFTPFANSQRLNSPWLLWLKDFNISPKPSNVSVRWDLDRYFTRNQYRGDDLLPSLNNIQFQKAFTFNRLYTLRWNLTNALVLDYNARANAIIDEPDGDINTEEKRQVVLDNLADLGRMKNFDQIIAATYRLPFDKIPLTSWINADARYEVNYSWTAGSFSTTQEDNQLERFGNLIQNRRTGGLTGKVDLVRLYNQSPYLKRINDARQAQARPNQPQPQRRPQATQPEGAQPEEEKRGEPSKFVQGVVRGLMAVRGVTFNATQSQGTMLPGFRPRSFLFGLDSGFVAPGVGFLLGSQDPNIRYRAAENGWLVTSPELTTPFTQTNTISYDLRADVQPITDLRIQVDVRKEKNANYQEIFRQDSLTRQYSSLTPARRGSYSISFLSIGTAFGDKEGEGGSAAFNRFAAYRQQIMERLGPDYQGNSQDVLIPAFLAAYSGQDPNRVKLSPFPSIPLPNWRLDYAGLGKVKALQKWFTSIALQHSYVSRYTVNNYSSSLAYGDELGADILELNNRIEDYTSADNLLLDPLSDNMRLPKYIANQVVISEKFAPLIGVNLRTKTRMTLQMSYNRERNLGLDMANTQVTELKSEDVRFDIGYTTKNFKIPFRIKGRETTLKNDITFRMGVTVRDTRTVQRRLDEPDDVTNGNINFQLNPTIDYIINQQLSTQLYFRRNVNEPHVLNSYPSSNTAFGVQLRYNITQ